MKVYLDACCHNRPFDDQSRDRIRLEAEAVVAILDRVVRGEWKLVGSEVLDVETARAPDPERRERVRRLTALADEYAQVDEAAAERARCLAGMGLHAFDALHVACAESGSADVFLTTDDQILSWAKRHADELRVRVTNPLVWLGEVLEP